MRLMKVLDNFLGFYLGAGVALWVILIVTLVAINVVMTYRYGEKVGEYWRESANQYSRSDDGLTYRDMVIGLFAWPLVVPITIYLGWITIREVKDRLPYDADLKKDRGDS